ncbi:MAG: DUF6320 domain-containing protein [Clostridia bacterium]
MKTYKKCKKCNVNIINNTNTCPLCKSILHDNNNTINNTYPLTFDNLNNYNLLKKILIFISIISAISCLVINIYVSSIPWSIIYILGIIYLWITIPYSIKMNVNIASKIVIHTITAIIILFILHCILLNKHWLILDFSIPIILTISNISLLVLQAIYKFHHENYIIYGLIISILSIIPLILINSHVITILLPSYILFGVAIFTLVSTIVFFTKDLIIELKKRFHY